MDKKTGTTITIVAAVITLCCSITCCGFSIWHMLDQGETLDLNFPPYYLGAPLICLSVLAWLVPLLLWIFLVRKQQGEEIAV